MNKPILIICVMTLFFYQISESLAAAPTATCSWAKDADGNNTTKLVVSGSGTFSGCQNTSEFSGWKRTATEIVIEKGIEKINEHAFSGMSNVTSPIVLPDSITDINFAAFWNMPNVTGSLIIPDSVTNIQASAFNGMKGITGSLIIPDSVTSIGTYAFSDMTGLTGSLTIPDSVTSIGTQVFSGIEFQELIIPDTLTPEQTALWSRAAFGYMKFPNGTIRCQGDVEKCEAAMSRYIAGKGCQAYCLPRTTQIKPIEDEAQCTGKYHWNGTSCNRMTERQCNDSGTYYYNGNECTRRPKNGKITCSSSYKINDGYCDRVRYTPAEAAAVANDDNTNVVTITFRK